MKRTVFSSVIPSTHSCEGNSLKTFVITTAIALKEALCPKLLQQCREEGELHFHVTVEKPWAQRGRVTCPEPPSEEGATQSASLPL